MGSFAGRWQALAAAVLFSTGGAALKTQPFTALQLSGLRSGIAALALLLWVGGRVRVSPRTLAGAVAYAATVTLFVAANTLTTAANAIFLQSAAPLFLVILAPLLLRERLLTRDIPFLIAVALGMWLAFTGSPPASLTAPDPPAGNLLALISSFTWALTLVSLRLMERDPAQQGGGLSVVVLGNVLASVVALPSLLTWPTAGAGNWLAVLYLGVVQIAVAYGCLTAAVRHLPAIEVSLLLLLEPVLNPIWTWIVHGEQPGWAVVFGGATILTATAVHVLAGRGRDDSRPLRA